MRSKLWGMLVVAACLLWSPPADAFCGFYVGGAGAKLFNNATIVVMMRDGTRTVLNMQNNYQGPPSNFAMVVPVPVVLQKENVKTLPPAVFDRVDKLAAPRLVEYWEQDPCYRPPVRRYGARGGARPKPMAMAPPGAKRERDLGVKVEAQFEVGEYEIVILSAKHSTGLDTWLRQNKYNIPAGAEPVLNPYVQQGMKFFVAKVNSKKVTFKNGQAMLSPLRFHYDSELFNLPVRLGLLNSKGKQDLIVHILAPNTRYEVANYDNITIPTNFDVSPRTKKAFGEFYAALFDEVVKRNPKSVVTEYAWQATGCDPCPGPPLGAKDFATLGGDVLASTKAGNDKPMPPRFRGRMMRGNNFVLTRLHTRYDKKALGEDLVFRKAPAILGGREVRDAQGRVERSVTKSSFNNFQARYIIRHAWSGPIACANPIRGRWGGPPAGVQQSGPLPARELAFVPRGRTQLKQFVSFNVTSPTRSLKSKGASLGIAGSIGKGQDTPAVPDGGSVQPAPEPVTTPEPVATAPQVAPTTPTAAPPVAAPPGPPPQTGGCGACTHNRPSDTATSLASHWPWLMLLLPIAVRRRRGHRQRV